jgi:hypothetical protein
MKKLTKEQKRQAAVIAAKTDIIKWLKSHGRGYQTRVNALLRHAMNSRWAARHEDEAPSPKGSSCIRWASRETRKRPHKTNTC